MVSNFNWEEKAKAFQQLLALRGEEVNIPCPCDRCKAGLHYCLLDNKAVDDVNHPPHYQGKRFESIDVIEDFELGFHLGNAIKYILRAGKKDNKVRDLKKAIWYLERECANAAEETANYVEEK